MLSMKSPLVESVQELIEEYSVPEVVEALLTIATYWKRRFKMQGHGEWRGWEFVEGELKKTLKAIDG